MDPFDTCLHEKTDYCSQEMKDLEVISITEEAVVLLKAHGSYQQQNRDLQRNDKQAYKESFQFMLRLKVPAGKIPPDVYRVIDDLATKYGQGDIRATTRQAFQVNIYVNIAKFAASLPPPADPRRAQAQPQGRHRRHRKRRLLHPRRLRRHQPQHHGAARPLHQRPGVPARLRHHQRHCRALPPLEPLLRRALARRREDGHRRVLEEGPPLRRHRQARHHLPDPGPPPGHRHPRGAARGAIAAAAPPPPPFPHASGPVLLVSGLWRWTRSRAEGKAGLLVSGQRKTEEKAERRSGRISVSANKL